MVNSVENEVGFNDICILHSWMREMKGLFIYEILRVLVNQFFPFSLWRVTLLNNERLWSEMKIVLQFKGLIKTPHMWCVTCFKFIYD